MTDPNPTPRPKSRLLRLALALSVVGGILACMDSGVVRVGVERSETGACPELTCWEPDPVDDDERDSPLSDGSQNTPPPAPVGLTFIGAGFYDDARPRLGPIVEGGTFELGLVLSSGGEVPEYRVEIDDTDVLSARYGTGDFAPGGVGVVDHVEDG